VRLAEQAGRRLDHDLLVGKQPARCGKS
jgi:hypothetical protein